MDNIILEDKEMKAKIRSYSDQMALINQDITTIIQLIKVDILDILSKINNKPINNNSNKLLISIIIRCNHLLEI